MKEKLLSIVKDVIVNGDVEEASSLSVSGYLSLPEEIKTFADALLIASRENPTIESVKLLSILMGLTVALGYINENFKQEE